MSDPISDFLTRIRNASLVSKESVVIPHSKLKEKLTELLVNEGDFVSTGELLARFDNRKQILADLSGINARIKTLDIKIRMQKREVSRYQKAAFEGAAAMVVLEESYGKF